MTVTPRASMALPLFALVFFATLMQNCNSVRAQEQPALVRVDEVRVEPLSQTVPVIGRLVARQAGVVAARVDAPVERFLVEVGDRVGEGQVIAELNIASLTARRDQAAGALEAARAAVQTDKAELQLLRQELKRFEGLKSSAAFSQANYEDALQNVVIAQAEIAQAEMAIVTAEADLQLREIDLANALIRAPYQGVITQRLTEAGAYVQTGDPVVRMISEDELEIEVDVPVQRLSGLTAGTTVEFRLEGPTRYRATVRAVVPAENPLTRTRPVRFVTRFDERLKSLANDQSVVVLVPIGARREVLSVHKDAVIKRPDGSLVFVVKDGKAEPRQVRLGQAIGSRLEVIDGLSAGDLSVIRGNERLRPGAAVRINGAS